MIELLLPTSVCLFATFLFLCVFAFSRRTTKLGRLRYGIVPLLLWAYCFSTPAIANAIIDSLEQQYPAVRATSREGGPLILVLSSGFAVKTATGYQARLDSAGWERTWAAIRLWRQVGGHLLFVGAPTPDNGSSVAAFMAEIATTSGVPPAAVKIEPTSHNTYENLAFTRALVESHGPPVWLVTSALHLPRAMAVARKLGMRLAPYPCDRLGEPFLHWYAWLPNSGGPKLFAAALHEMFGLVYYRMKGFAD